MYVRACRRGCLLSELHKRSHCVAHRKGLRAQIRLREVVTLSLVTSSAATGEQPAFKKSAMRCSCRSNQLRPPLR